MTQLTIELPEQLAAQLTAQVENYSTETLAELIRDALQIRLVPKNTFKLLALAGIITEVHRGAAKRAEDFED